VRRHGGSRGRAGVDILPSVNVAFGTIRARPLPDLWRYRGLVGLLVWRDLKVRYKRSVLGMLWTLLNPLLQMGVYTLVFSRVLRVAVPAFPVFVLSGLLPWTLVSVSAISSSNCLLANQALIRKVAVPQAVYPLAIVASKLFDVVLSFVPLALVAVALGRAPGASWAFLVPAVVAAASFAAGLSLVFASLTVFFRDVRHLLDVLFQLWFYATPILYPPEALDAIGNPAIRGILAANPMSPIVRTFQAAAYEGRAPAPATLAAALAIGVGTLVAGWVLFERLEPRHIHWI
jgi:lipopolysaccharide transport system permease protein